MPEASRWTATGMRATPASAPPSTALPAPEKSPAAISTAWSGKSTFAEIRNCGEAQYRCAVMAAPPKSVHERVWLTRGPV